MLSLSNTFYSFEVRITISPHYQIAISYSLLSYSLVSLGVGPAQSRQWITWPRAQQHWDHHWSVCLADDLYGRSHLVLLQPTAGSLSAWRDHRQEKEGIYFISHRSNLSIMKDLTLCCLYSLQILRKYDFYLNMGPSGCYSVNNGGQIWPL